MICKVCGKQIPKEYLTMDRFSCPSCGKVYHKKTTQQPSVEPTKYGSHQTENQDVSDIQIPESTKRLSLKKYLFIVIILLILLIVIVVVNGRNTKSIIVSNPSSIDGEWYYSGYVDFYNLFCDGVFSSEEDWKTSISERLIDPQPGNTNDRIKIIDGTIVDRNGYSGTVSVSPISSSEYEYYYDYDGERTGGSIARVGQELHLYDKGELYIYSLAGTTPQWLLNGGKANNAVQITPQPTKVKVTAVPTKKGITLKPYQETNKKDNENLKYTLIFISIVAIGIALFVYIRGRLTKCPECGKKFAMIEISRKTVDSRSTTMDIERQVKDSKGNVIRTYLEAVPATKFYYDCVDECKYCGYRRRVSREATYRD